MATKTLLTIEQFDRFPDTEGILDELNGGLEDAGLFPGFSLDLRAVFEG